MTDSCSAVSASPFDQLTTIDGTDAARARSTIIADSPQAHRAERQFDTDQLTNPDSPADLTHAVEVLLDVMNELGEAICVVDRSLRVRIWSEQAGRLSGHSAAEVVGQFWSGQFVLETTEFLEPGERPEPLLARCLAVGGPLFQRGYLRCRDGELRPIDSRAVPIRDRHGQVIGAVEAFRDASHVVTLESENEKLRRLSLTDPLTQVVNRAGFDGWLRDRLETYRKTGQRCSLIMTDLDHFKSINDTFGHQAGDAVLKLFAEIAKNCCRENDVVARYGGEEFAMILPGCDLKTAFQRAEQIRLQLAATSCNETSGRPVTASFGTTQLEDHDIAASFVARADEALYRSKQKGRNRTEMAGADELPDNWETAAYGSRQACTWVVTSPSEVTLLKIDAFLRELEGKVLERSVSRIHFRSGASTFLETIGLRRPRPQLDLEISMAHMHTSPQTVVRVTVQVTHSQMAREKRESQCHEILNNLRHYLMAEPAELQAAAAQESQSTVSTASPGSVPQPA